MYKQDLLLLGGSFNPVHHGHLAICNAARKVSPTKFCLVMPAKQNPFKKHIAISPLEERIKACNEYFSNESKIKVVNYETLSDDYQTSIVLKKVRTRFYDKNFIWIMGMDNLAHFDKWYQYNEIIKHHKIIVVARGDAITKLKMLNARFVKINKQNISFKNSHYVRQITIINSPWTNISSTELRIQKESPHAKSINRSKKQCAFL